MRDFGCFNISKISHPFLVLLILILGAKEQNIVVSFPGRFVVILIYIAGKKINILVKYSVSCLSVMLVVIILGSTNKTPNILRNNSVKCLTK